VPVFSLSVPNIGYIELLRVCGYSHAVLLVYVHLLIRQSKYEAADAVLNSPLAEQVILFCDHYSRTLKKLLRQFLIPDTH